MHKPVDKVEFWKERIETAQKQHYSVYVTGEEDWKHINKAHEEIFHREIKPTDIVLDAGCGYGRWAKYFDREKYIGIDLSPDFLDIARKENPEHSFQLGRLEHLKFPDKFFDVAFCISIKDMIVDNLGEVAWHFMESELKRVAKKVLIMEYTAPEKYITLWAEARE